MPVSTLFRRSICLSTYKSISICLNLYSSTTLSACIYIVPPLYLPLYIQFLLSICLSAYISTSICRYLYSSFSLSAYLLIFPPLSACIYIGPPLYLPISLYFHLNLPVFIKFHLSISLFMYCLSSYQPIYVWSICPLALISAYICIPQVCSYINKTLSLYYDTLISPGKRAIEVEGGGILKSVFAFFSRVFSAEGLVRFDPSYFWKSIEIILYSGLVG